MSESKLEILVELNEGKIVLDEAEKETKRQISELEESLKQEKLKLASIRRLVKMVDTAEANLREQKDLGDIIGSYPTFNREKHK